MFLSQASLLVDSQTSGIFGCPPIREMQTDRVEHGVIVPDALKPYRILMLYATPAETIG
jgi:hypothetical protein